MEKTNITIRETNKADFNDIMEVEKTAFEIVKETELTTNLLNDPTAKPYLSLLAFQDGEAVGYLLFTRTYIEEIDPNQSLHHMLTPLAVKPEFQKQGIVES